MYPRNYVYPVKILRNDWNKRQPDLGIYHRWDYSNYPLPSKLGYQKGNTAEFIQDNISIRRGNFIVRDESEYELNNMIILPYQTRPGFVITPKRLARDPHGAIHNYYYGWKKNPSDEHVLQNTTRWKDRLLNRRRATRT